MERAAPVITLAARFLLALIFVLAGYDKIGGYEGTQQYMEAFGVPGGLLPLVILAELGAGLAIVFGFLTRISAAALALFCIVSGVIFHGNFDEPMQQILFMKNIAIAGGMLMLVAHGPGKLSVDEKLGLKY